MSRDLAVIGMVCAVPGAENIEQFWDMLLHGKEGLRTLTPEECKISAAEHTVNAGGFIAGIDQFDPAFFGYTARDAEFMDPQHRLFLQACAQALDTSGNASPTHQSVGVFACASHNAYLTEVLLKQGIEQQQYQAALLGNSPDCLATRVSYCLNLTGPSMTIQNGCSSSLVAVHQARLALLTRQCDLALVGGISLIIPQNQGYTPVEGGFASPDGHCRPFSDDAAGTVFSSGYGVLLLKRLPEALKDGDTIYSVIKGSAVNNDGAEKASFTAPCVQGQVQVIAKALRIAEADPESIQYVEAHGTGTPIGDPVELAALTEVFQNRVSTCTLGSVKANIGHLDVAAGIIGLIKTSLMLYFKTLTPQIHFKQWNPRIVGNPTLFKINTTPQQWEKNGATPRRSGVSAFGFGGTNAHIILEESPTIPSTIAEHALSSLIILSASSADRLLAWIRCLAAFLQKNPSISLTRLAYTLQTGRKQEAFRYSTQTSSIDDLITKLTNISISEFRECKEQISFAFTSELDRTALNSAWLAGAIIDWSKAYVDTVQKVILPPTPLQLSSYWLQKQNVASTVQTQEKKYPDYSQWLYQITWQETQCAHAALSKQPVVLVGDANQPSLQLVTQHCQNEQIPYLVLSALTQHDMQQWNGCRVLHWIDTPRSWEDTPNSIEQMINWVTNPHFIRSVQQYVFIVNGMSDLFCHNNHPHLNAFLAFSRGIRQEMPHMATKIIDLDPQEQPHLQCKQIINSVMDTELSDHAIWRDHRCWQMQYKNPKKNEVQAPTYFKKGGTYLITGGFGDVASVHIDFLAQDYQATLVLLSRTAVPSEEHWEACIQDSTTPESIKKRLHQLISWRAKGYSIIPVTADITSKQEVQQVCETIGTIDGIVHIAGAGSDMHYKVLSELTAAHCKQLFQPKLRGLEVIAQVMNEFSIPDCLIISSISSVLAGIGLAAYASVHNLLDAYVKKYHPNWRIMNWDAWNFHLKEADKVQNSALGASLDKLAITPEEGLTLLRQAFSQNDWQQLLISTVDLSTRIKQWLYSDGKKAKAPIKNQLHPRPTLRSEYVKASTVVQQQLIDIWESLIGVTPIGIQDNFFEAGGDSLLAFELIRNIQSTFQHACTIMDLFAAGTIEQLAKKISPNPVKQNNRLSKVRERAEKQRAALAAYSKE